MSIQELTDIVIEFIKTHQTWAIPIAFLLAFCESLAIVSLLVPATAMLLATGILIGADSLAFLPIWLAITLGAILGDYISFWLGKHYHDKLITSWPLKKYPNALSKAEKFFQNYGLASVFIGRFFGPFRAFVPLIAGSMYMSSTKFNIANITSSPIWASVMLAPGMFGTEWLITLFG